MVQFAVKGKDENLNTYINAFVTDICYPVEHQQIDLAKQTYSHLQSLDLADNNPNNLPLDIDILLGAKHYWNIIGKHQVRGEYGPVALGSKLGYALNGPIENSQSNATLNSIVSTRFMRVEAEFINSDFISNQNIKNCCDSMKASKNEKVLDNFNSLVNFKDGRYEVSFPFKEFHQESDDDYLTSKGRLKNLFKKCKENKELLFEYDKIINEQINLNIVEKVTDYEVGATHYFPHRPVIREDKETTKTRIVFDASCKRGVEGPSLNYILDLWSFLDTIAYRCIIEISFS